MKEKNLYILIKNRLKVYENVNNKQVYEKSKTTLIEFDFMTKKKNEMKYLFCFIFVEFSKGYLFQK